MSTRSQDLDDAGVLEHAASVLQRRYPGTRPEPLDDAIASLQWIVRAIRRRAEATPAATATQRTRPVNTEQRPCRAHPDDCPNGPGPHAYYNPPEFEGRMCCCRQPGEPETPPGELLEELF